MVTQQTGQALAGWRLYGAWVLANLVGWLTGGVLLFAIGWGLDESLNPHLGDVIGSTLGFVLGAAAGGALIGVMQGIVLQERGVALGSWIGASAGGLALGMAFVMPIAVSLQLAELDLRIVAGFSVIGLAMAVPQWLVLRRVLPRAEWWVPTTTLAIVVFFLCAFLLGGEGNEVRAFGAGALACATVSGLAVIALLPRRA